MRTRPVAEPIIISVLGMAERRAPVRLLEVRAPERPLAERALGARLLLVGARGLLERALPEREDGRAVPEAAR